MFGALKYEVNILELENGCRVVRWNFLLKVQTLSVFAIKIDLLNNLWIGELDTPKVYVLSY